MPHSASSVSFAAAGSKGTKYIRVKAKNKDRKEFQHLFLAQELSTETKAPAQLFASPAASPALSSRSFKLAPETTGGQNSSGDSQTDNRPAAASSSKGSSADELNGNADSDIEDGPTSEGGHQSTSGHGGGGKKRRGVWALKFSLDGSHLAAGCQDGVVRVWAVVQTDQERQQALLDSLGRGTEDDDLDLDSLPAVPLAPTPSGRCIAGNKKPHRMFHMPVFNQTPCREFRGHTADVLDVSWSKNGFLLSSSIVRTLHPS